MPLNNISTLKIQTIKEYIDKFVYVKIYKLRDTKTHVSLCTKSLQLCPTSLCPKDCNPHASSVHRSGKNNGVVASRGIFPPRDQMLAPCVPKCW